LRPLRAAASWRACSARCALLASADACRGRGLVDARWFCRSRSSACADRCACVSTRSRFTPQSLKLCDRLRSVDIDVGADAFLGYAAHHDLQLRELAAGVRGV